MIWKQYMTGRTYTFLALQYVPAPIIMRSCFYRFDHSESMFCVFLTMVINTMCNKTILSKGIIHHVMMESFGCGHSNCISIRRPLTLGGVCQSSKSAAEGGSSQVFRAARWGFVCWDCLPSMKTPFKRAPPMPITKVVPRKSARTWS